VQEIENPNPQPGTNNFWIQDGYGGFGNYGHSTGHYYLVNNYNPRYFGDGSDAYNDHQKWCNLSCRDRQQKSPAKLSYV
jgi:phospholipase C